MTGTDNQADIVSVIDWQQAVRAGQRRVKLGPKVTAAEAHQVVTQLHEAAEAAELQVRETTGLGHDLPIEKAEVVDRRGWVAATAAGMEILAAPLLDAIPDDFGQQAQNLASKEVGWVLGYLSSKVLGQYDPVGGGGRLLLVAPNIVQVGRQIGADPHDFRRWVCLHESTHRLQFSAAPYMRGHFVSLVSDYGALAPQSASAMLPRLGDILRNKGDGAGESWMQRMQTPQQRPLFDQILALMTLLEGHADYIMDAVGPQVIPTVAEIRTAFNARRNKRRGPLERIARALLGMDLKMAQYARGAEFVRGVVGQVGMSEFNAVFASAANLPTMAEIGEPSAWVRRVLG